MKSIFRRVFIAIVLLSNAATAEVILRYFGTTWCEIERRIPELAERGYDSLWPPPFKAGAGPYSGGFDTLDRFDLGDRDQSDTVRTKYATKANLVSMVRVAHRFGIRVYFDNVMAHNAGAVRLSDQPGQLFPGVPGFVPEDFGAFVLAVEVGAVGGFEAFGQAAGLSVGGFVAGAFEAFDVGEGLS